MSRPNQLEIFRQLLKKGDDFTIPDGAIDLSTVRKMRAQLSTASQQVGIKVSSSKFRDDLVVKVKAGAPNFSINSAFVLTLRNGEPANKEVLEKLGAEAIKEKIGSGQLTKSAELAAQLNRNDERYLNGKASS